MLAKVFQNSVWYSLSSLLLRASSIIFFPIFSSYLTKADYGILSMTQGIILWITAVASLSMRSTFLRFLNSEKSLNDSNYKSKVLGNIIIICLASILVFGLISLIFGEQILTPLLNDIDYEPYMYYSIVGMIATYIVNIYRYYLKSIHRGKASFWFDISFFSANIMLNLFFVVVMGTDVIGLIYSTVICGVVFTVIASFGLVKDAIFKIDKKLIIELLKYSFPLVPFILLGMGIETISTFFLNKEIGKEATGIFYIALTFASVFSTLKESIISAISPWFFEHYETQNKLVHKLIYHVIWGGAICCFLISVFSFELLRLLSNNVELVVGWKYIPVVLVGYLVIFIGQIFNLPIYHKQNKNNLLVIGSLIGFLSTFLFSYFFAKYGIIAASLSKTIGYSIMTAFFLWITKVVNFKVDYKKIIVLISIFVPLFFMNFITVNYFILLSIKFIVSIVLLIHFLREMLKNYIGIKRIYLSILQHLFK